MERVNNYMIPIMVIACSILALIGYVFSARLANIDENTPLDNAQVLGALKNIEGESLLEINDNTGTSYYYKGDSEDNYILLNNLMFRIVRFNGDGTIRVILDSDVLNSNFNNVEYEKSNAKKLLDNWRTINFGDASYLVEEDYDVTNYVTYETYNLINFEGYMIDYVGLLSVREADIISQGLDKTYLDNGNGIYLSNGSGLYDVWYYKDGKIDVIDAKTKLSLRPVLNIKYNELSGKGTKLEPFELEEE